MKTIILKNKGVETQRSKLICPASSLVLKPSLPTSIPPSQIATQSNCVIFNADKPLLYKLIEANVKRKRTKGSLVLALFSGMVTQGLFLPVSILVTSFKIVEEPFPHIIPWSRMFFIFIDLTYHGQKAKPWKKFIVIAPFWGGYPAGKNPQFSECFSTPTQDWFPAALH